MNEHRLKERWKREDEDQINAAIGALLQHGGGRRLLWWLLQIGRIGGQPYTRNALDTAFNCGELNVGQQILERITSVSPERYVEMMKEMADERTRRDTQLGDARANAGTFADQRDTDSDAGTGGE